LNRSPHQNPYPARTCLPADKTGCFWCGDRKGVTLVEILISAVIFIIAISAFNFFLKTARTSLETAEQLSLSHHLLEAQMEELRSLTFQDLPALQGKTFGQGKGTITITSLDADLLSLRLDYQNKPKQALISLETLRSKY